LWLIFGEICILALQKKKKKKKKNDSTVYHALARTTRIRCDLKVKFKTADVMRHSTVFPMAPLRSGGRPRWLAQPFFQSRADKIAVQRLSVVTSSLYCSYISRETQAK
jgi:hypothetical protein